MLTVFSRFSLIGSGPAYFFHVIEALVASGVRLGLPPDVARGLAAQTCLGAGRMALDSDVDVAELRRRVTSPNGTTEAALGVLQKGGMLALFDGAVQAAFERSVELGDANANAGVERS